MTLTMVLFARIRPHRSDKFPATAMPCFSVGSQEVPRTKWTPTVAVHLGAIQTVEKSDGKFLLGNSE